MKAHRPIDHLAEKQPSLEGDLLCKYLPWDSDFFGRRIGRITARRLGPETIGLINEWCLINRIDCIYFLADSTDDETVLLAEKNRFHLVDICLTLERRLDNNTSLMSTDDCAEIRPAKLDDIEVLRSIASVSHVGARFYHDTNFPERRCNELYETWIEESCRGYADIVFVSTVQGKPVGYVTCHIEDKSQGRIGLFAVDSKAQGKGIGRQLINRLLSWAVERGLTQMIVVTQGRNHVAQRLYQSCDFRTKEAAIWYHRWFLAERE